MKTENSNVLESAKAREIVQTIMDFGVTQYQIKKIIKMLSLELEDMNIARNISSIIEEKDSDQTKPRIEL
tara:strand:+ start:240 stop:449 length:210 start_codon:yes stop_codon:yes gene_type:complete